MQRVSEELPKRLTRAEQQAETRRRVLAAADRVFTERGFHAARLEEIAAHAGYTRGAVYSNFKNKDELALAIIEERIAKSKALLEELAATQAPDVEGAHAVGEAFSKLFVEPNPWAPLFLEFVTHASRHPELAERLRAPYQDLADAITKALEAASEQAGMALPAASQRLARIMLAATNGSDVERIIDPGRIDGTLAGEMLGWIAAGLIASNTET
jgi:AcrR family transcriptional regulator